MKLRSNFEAHNTLTDVCEFCKHGDNEFAYECLTCIHNQDNYESLIEEVAKERKS